MNISFKDDVTVILLLGVSFGLPTRVWLSGNLTENVTELIKLKFIMSPNAEVSYMIVDTANQDLDMATDPFLEVIYYYYSHCFFGFSIFPVEYDGLQSLELKTFA